MKKIDSLVTPERIQLLEGIGSDFNPRRHYAPPKTGRSKRFKGMLLVEDDNNNNNNNSHEYREVAQTQTKYQQRYNYNNNVAVGKAGYNHHAPSATTTTNAGFNSNTIGNPYYSYEEAEYDRYNNIRETPYS